MGEAIHLELRFPNLARTQYILTSPKSQEYNCFAWVAGDRERWWQPTPEDEFYWVEGVPKEETLSAYVQAYRTLGYITIHCSLSIVKKVNTYQGLPIKSEYLPRIANQCESTPVVRMAEISV